MAEETATRRRSRPRPAKQTEQKSPEVESEAPQTPEPEPVPDETEAKQDSKKAAKEPSLYHIYTTDDEGKTLVWVADKEVKTGDVAVSELVAENQKLVGVELVAVPDRNYKVYKTEVETKTRVKVSAA